MPESIAKFIATIQSSMKTHQWYWVGGGGGVVLVAVIAVLVFGGVFGPSGKAVCQATLDQAKDFGVIAPDATLSSSRAKSTDVDGRKQCTASAGGVTYNLLVDVKKQDDAKAKCKDFKKQASCLVLYSVATTEGMASYQVKQVPDDDQEAAATPPAGGGAAPSGADAGTAPADPNGLDSETAPATGDTQSAPAGDSGQPQ